MPEGHSHNHSHAHTVPMNLPTMDAMRGVPNDVQKEIKKKLYQTKEQMEKQLLQAKGDNEVEGRCYSGLAAVHLQLGDTETSVKFSKLCLEKADALGQGLVKVGVWNNMCVAYQQQRKFYHVMAAASQMLTEVSKYQEQAAWLGRAHFLLADCYHKTNQLALAIVHFRKCLEASAELKVGMGYSKCQVLCCLGQCLQNTKEYEEAMPFYEQALDHLEGLPDIPRVRCNVSTAWGGCYLYLKQLEKATQKFDDAIKNAKDTPNPTVLPSITSTIGKAYTDAGYHEKSIEQHREALTLYSKADPPCPEEVRTEHYYLGVAMREVGKLQESVDHLALALSDEKNPLRGAIYQNLGITYSKMTEGDVSAHKKKAIEFRKKDLDIAKSDDKTQAVAFAHLGLAVLFAQTEDFPLAEQHAKEGYNVIENLYELHRYTAVLRLLIDDEANSTVYCTAAPSLPFLKHRLYTITYLATGQFHKQLEHALLMQKASVQLDTEQQMEANILVGKAYTELAELKKAKDIFRQVSKVEGNNATNKIQLAEAEGLLYNKESENMQAYKKLQEVIKAQPNNLLVALKLANLQHAMGQEDAAFKLINGMLSDVQQKEPKQPVVEADVYGALGHLHLLGAKLDKALDMHLKRVEIAQENGGIWSDAKGHSDIGSIYLEGKRDIPSALSHFRVARQKSEDSCDSHLRCYVTGQVGYCLMLSADAKAAVKVLEKHVNIAEELGETQHVARSLKSLCAGYNKLGDKELSQQFKERLLKFEERNKK